jgi:hypothetical protein
VNLKGKIYLYNNNNPKVSPKNNKKISDRRFFPFAAGAKNFIFMLTQQPKGVPKKLIKTFLIEDFFHLPPVQMTTVVHLELRTSPRIFENCKRP